MSTRDVSAIPRGPVRVVKDPTNLSAAFPYGGTELGAARQVRVVWLEPTAKIRAEEKGGRTVDAISGGRGMIAYMLLRGFDATALALAFGDTASSGGSLAIKADDPGTVRPGALLSNRTCKILLAAERETDRSVLIYRAMPMVVDQSETVFSILGESAIEFAIEAIPDTSSRIYAVNPIAGLSL